MISKSKAAFLLTCEKLYEQEGTLYFWTFTFVDVFPDWYYSNIWARFFRDLQDLYGGMLQGVKVTELHENHGVHYHCLFNRRVWVGEVRRLGKKYGIGRVEVQVAHKDSGKYLSKYIGKKEKAGRYLSPHIRKWSTVGGFVGCKVRNIEVDCAMSRNVKKAQLCIGKKQIPFYLIRELSKHERDLEFKDVACMCAGAALRESRKVTNEMLEKRYGVFGVGVRGGA